MLSPNHGARKQDTIGAQIWITDYGLWVTDYNTEYRIIIIIIIIIIIVIIVITVIFVVGRNLPRLEPREGSLRFIGMFHG